MKLPKWLLDLLTMVVMPMIKLIGKNGVIELLSKMAVKNPNYYRTVIILGYRALVVHLKPLADKTPADWDNETVDTAIEALVKSAEDHGVPLPDVTIMPEPVTELPPADQPPA